MLDRRHVQSVLSDRHRQLAHRHAHPVRKVLTLRPAQVAYRARQGRTVRLGQRSAHLVLEDHHQRLGHRRAQNDIFIE